MGKIKDLKGRVFGRLTVESLVGILPCEKDGHRRARYFCICECGNHIEEWSHVLLSRRACSCGCLRTENAIKQGHKRATHGLSTKPTYRAWQSIKQRCNNPQNKDYPIYGALGIKMCDRWIESFENFLDDMGIRPEGKTLDRKDPNGNYEPRNCRWATWEEQNDPNHKRIFSGNPNVI